MTDPIRVLVVDDHEIVRRGIRALIATKHDMVVVGEAGTGDEAVARARELRPDVVLMDLLMPGTDGIEATRAISTLECAPRVLVLTSFAADEQIFPAIKAGALGYLLKDTGPEELLKAIRSIHRGEPTLDASVARKVLGEISGSPKKKLAEHPLSARELDVLRLIAQGRSNRDIAERLFLSEDTIHTHVGNILGKLHLASRTQAALYALREGIASLEDVPGPE
jgi:two-component system, NarL family, response regulator LiaR